jgi:hypothetical protein
MKIIVVIFCNSTVIVLFVIRLTYSAQHFSYSLICPFLVPYFITFLNIS